MTATELGPLGPLFADPLVSDVLVNGPDEVWVESAGRLRRVPVRFGGDDDVLRLAVRLVTTAGRRLDSGCPCADAALSGGLRLHAVLPPVSERPVISIRVLASRPRPLDDLVRPAGLADLLRALVRSRVATLLTGGTGTGKTTLLGALLGELGSSERVVLVEDPPELRPTGGHVVRLAARAPNAEGAGAVSQRQLVREALRMRPDRLVVGEVRGPEILDLLVALNTGHEGGLATIHANAASDLPARAAALGALAGLSRPALDSLLLAGVRTVVHLHRAARVRGVAEIGLLRAGRHGRARVQPAVTVHGDELVAGPGWPTLHRLLG